MLPNQFGLDFWIRCIFALDLHICEENKFCKNNLMTTSLKYGSMYSTCTLFSVIKLGLSKLGSHVGCCYLYAYACSPSRQSCNIIEVVVSN